MVRSDTWKTRRPVFIWREHHYKQFTARHVGKWCPSTGSTTKSYSWTGLCTCLSFSHSPWLFESEFPGRWGGVGRPLAWPLRTSDLTPLDLFLWDCERDQVYSQRVNTVDEHEVRIAVARRVTARLEKVDCRWDMCRATYGAHCEVFRT
jgi:hypothetical protein